MGLAFLEVHGRRRSTGSPGTHKYAIGLREARESRHWLRLIAIDEACATDLQPLIAEATEFIAMLTVSVRKLRDKDPRG
jgi:hypothetical protein